MTMQASATLCLAAHSFDYFHTSLNCIIGQYAEDDENCSRYFWNEEKSYWKQTSYFFSEYVSCGFISEVVCSENKKI